MISEDFSEDARRFLKTVDDIKQVIVEDERN